MVRSIFVAILAVSTVVTISAATGCAGSIDDDSAGGSTGTGKGDGPNGDNATGDPESVARAKEWVDARVPYCQAANHEHDDDADCASTCTRPDVSDWDAYRSDCAGLLSWSWGLPPPGRTTSTLAPYDNEVSHAIDAVNLSPGDAINSNHHTMLFVEWLDGGDKARFYEEPGCSTSQPYAREYIATITSTSGHTISLQYRGTFTAIRRAW